MYASISGGGTAESFDQGMSWKPFNRGVAMDFMPGEPGDFGHDPHCMILHPADPDRLYQQNHCGIYALDRKSSERWKRVGRKMPKKVGDGRLNPSVEPSADDRTRTPYRIIDSARLSMAKNISR